jgi:tRNA splicing ligase
MSALKKLWALSADKKSKVRVKDYKFQTNTRDYDIFSFVCQDFVYRKGTLPMNARGLFVWKHSDSDKIVIRGYDKFFNGCSLSVTIDKSD